MDADRKKEIREKALEVSKGAERFQLIHATYAARGMIKEIVTDYYKKRYDSLSARVREKMDKGIDDVDAEMKEKKELDAMVKQSSFHIDVDYINTYDEDTARVVKINNAFVINLPKSLADRIFDKNGEYNYEVIHKIRGLMAHELGHLLLHTGDLLQIDGTQGSKLITNDEKELEARYFADELIELRKKRNEKLYTDRAYQKF
ncbi:MAG: ImmA/IrrE family metallo-endopeptidase [Lachnospiraceae bacterium]|nr:ImmA/IrrE family metallo-endopeptidase [Lachnospiraceae bacterium]